MAKKTSRPTRQTTRSGLPKIPSTPTGKPSTATGGTGPARIKAAYGYDAAVPSMQRGYIYWPTLSPRDEINVWTRREIARKVHYLMANMGLARRLLTSITNMVVGNGFTPQATTRDSEWNVLADAAYNRRARSAATYDVSARLTGIQMQRLAYLTQKKDGDAAIVFSESQSGGALRRLYSGTQVGEPIGTLDKKMNDGIAVDRLGRAQAFYFLDDDFSKTTRVGAENVVWLCNQESPGQFRGVSALAHAVNKLIDITELNASVMQGIKLSNQIGYYLASQDKDATPGIMDALAGKYQTDQVVGSDNTGNLQSIRTSEVFGMGGEIKEVPPGYDIKTLLDQRPHPNSVEFVENSLIRDCCWGLGISDALGWSIAKFGGAGVRYVLADAQAWIASEQANFVDTWLARDWVYTIAKEIKAGRLRKCKDPSFWSHSWVPPEQITCDFGRDGRIYLEQHRTGLISTERLYNLKGQDAKEEVSREMNFALWRKQEMENRGLSMSDLYPELKVQQAPDAAEEAAEEEDPTPGSN